MVPNQLPLSQALDTPLWISKEWLLLIFSFLIKILFPQLFLQMRLKPLCILGLGLKIKDLNLSFRVFNFNRQVVQGKRINLSNVTLSWCLEPVFIADTINIRMCMVDIAKICSVYFYYHNWPKMHYVGKKYYF